MFLCWVVAFRIIWPFGTLGKFSQLYPLVRIQLTNTQRIYKSGNFYLPITLSHEMIQ